jgi:cysteine desulfurase
MLAMTHIYVDHAATTPIHPQVVQAMLPYLDTHYGNPSSIHGMGRKARGAIDQARRVIASSLHVEPSTLVFTSGGTEADNMALVGVALANQHKGKHIITSMIEHHAVLHTCQFLEQLGFEVTYLPVDQDGRVRVNEVEEALRDDTILVSIMYGNNEVGTIQPITEIGQLLRNKATYFHTDAVQAFGIDSLNPKAIGIDLLSASSHKINGPKGIGLLYVQPDVRLNPMMYGGTQERNRRAGTENLAAIVGFAEATQIAYREVDERRSKYEVLRKTMLHIFDEEEISFDVNGHPAHYLPHILNVSFHGVKSDVMLMNLDLSGVAASSGSACSAGSLQPSHVLQAMYKDEERILSAIRFSFGLGNTEDEAVKIAQKTSEIIKRVKNKDK